MAKNVQKPSRPGVKRGGRLYWRISLAGGPLSMLRPLGLLRLLGPLRPLGLSSITGSSAEMLNPSAYTAVLVVREVQLAIGVPLAIAATEVIAGITAPAVPVARGAKEVSWIELNLS